MARKPTPRKPRTWRAWAVVVNGKLWAAFPAKTQCTNAMWWHGSDVYDVVRVTIEEVSKR
jgi:hypothetical protein